MADNVIQFPVSEKRDDADATGRVYQVKATVLYTDPVVWRRFLIPSDDTCFLLGDAVLAAFDWSGEYGFYLHKGGLFLDDPVLMQQDAKMPRMKGEVHRPADDMRICDAVKPGESISLFYDMEDYWEVRLDVEEALEDDIARFPFMPVCTDGENAAPPEGVGGTIGYADFCVVMANPSDPRYRETREWLGLPPGQRFDPTSFSAFDVNASYAIEAIDDHEDELLPEKEEDVRELCKMLLAERMASYTCMALEIGDAGAGRADRGDA